MCGGDHDFAALEVLPVALYDRECWWRDLALSSLEEAGCRYKVVFTSESTVGVRSAVQAGIAAALLNQSEDTKGLRRLPNLTNRYQSYLVLQKAGTAKAPVHEAICGSIRRAFAN
jgi:DNA-binding transcriptional LysR family regulator